MLGRKKEIKIPTLIEKQKDFKALCKTVKRGDVVAIDIEFMRFKTFYPLLCLIQLNIKGENYAIDVMSEDINLRPFAKILKSRFVVKVLHSSFQDLGIIFQELKLVPKNLFDTQLMANFLGFNYNISYANLVKELLDEDLSKDQQMSNWKKRPLSIDQIQYALNDVRYLPEIYKDLREELEETGKFKFFREEMRRFLKSKTYNIEKQDLFKKFPFTNKSNKYRKTVKTLVVWRDKSAKKRNIPRSFVLKDQVISDIAKSNSFSRNAITRILVSHNIKNTRFTRIIVELIQGQRKVREKRIKFVNSRMDEKQKKLYSRAQKLLRTISGHEGIRPEIIINQFDLKQIILGHLKLKKLLRGWRYKVFGKELKILLK